MKRTPKRVDESVMVSGLVEKCVTGWRLNIGMVENPGFRRKRVSRIREGICFYFFVCLCVCFCLFVLS